MSKQELRKYVREMKKSFSKEELALMSAQISHALLKEDSLLKAKTVLAFFPLPDEVSIIPVIDSLVSQGKTVLLPQVISDTEMIIREYHSAEDLKEGAFGILEPTGKEFTEYVLIETAIIPGMAFDESGNRLGRGKGYYDRFLASMKHKSGKLPYLIGVAFPFQIVAKVPTDIHDERMDKVIKL